MATEYSDRESNEVKNYTTRKIGKSFADDTLHPSNRFESVAKSDSPHSPHGNVSRGEVPRPRTGHQGVDHYESNSRPVHERSPAEDDELGEEISEDDHREDFIQENELEQTDPDYRDGVDQYAENQDDEDALRNGK